MLPAKKPTLKPNQQIQKTKNPYEDSQGLFVQYLKKGIFTLIDEFTKNYIHKDI